MVSSAWIGTSASSRRCRPGKPVSSITQANVLQDSAEATNEIGSRDRCAARGEEVVDEEDPLAGTNRVLVDLQRVGTVFQRIGLADGLVRKLARLPHRDKANPEGRRYRCTEDQAARLHAGDLVKPSRPVAPRDPVRHVTKPITILN